MFVCVCICMAFTGQMEVSEIVELELEAVGNSLMCVLGIEFGSSVRAVGALSCCQSCLLTPSPPGSEAMANPPSSSFSVSRTTCTHTPCLLFIFSRQCNVQCVLWQKALLLLYFSDPFTSSGSKELPDLGDKKVSSFPAMGRKEHWAKSAHAWGITSAPLLNT